MREVCSAHLLCLLLFIPLRLLIPYYYQMYNEIVVVLLHSHILIGSLNSSAMLQLLSKMKSNLVIREPSAAHNL